MRVLSYAADSQRKCLERSSPVLDVILAGATGNVGGTLLRQILRLDHSGIRIAGIANSRRTLLGDRPRIEALDTAGTKTNWNDTLSDIDEPANGARLFVDCTASEEVAGLYGSLLKRGIGVVTANKIAGAGAFERWSALRSLASDLGLPLRYETTVGAALPILGTARSLKATGDRVVSIDAVLSGSLSFVMGRLHEGMPFSAAVDEACVRGLTEPDPLIDLSGRDVVRKLVILLREVGVSLEERDVDVEPLASTSAEIVGRDDEWRKRVDRAMSSGSRLVFAASFSNGVARASVCEVDSDHPMARLRAGENIVIFTTDRYDHVPLTIMGPGAGAEVTAAGLLAEIVDIAGA